MTISDYSGKVVDFDTFLSYLDAMAMIISEMFGSNCEVVISDLDDPENSILSIYNGQVTGRKPGDPLTTRSEELIRSNFQDRPSLILQLHNYCQTSPILSWP